jgi:hypothetical protein
MSVKKKILILLAVAVAVVIALFLWRSPVTNTEMTGDIEKFRYDFGSYFGGYYSYELERRYDGTVAFEASGGNGVELNIYTYIDPAYLEELAQIVNESGIYTWNGFNKSDDGLMDGYGFTLEASYSDGRTLTADGYGKEPGSYNVGHQALSDFFDKLCNSYDKSFTENHPGILGNAEYIIYRYKTPDGEEKEYSLMISTDDTASFTVEVDGREKETAVDKEAVQKLGDLIDEKEIYKWDGFEEGDYTAEDGVGFSIMVHYTNDKMIWADGYGSYPESYEKGHQALVEFFEFLGE